MAKNYKAAEYALTQFELLITQISDINYDEAESQLPAPAWLPAHYAVEGLAAVSKKLAVATTGAINALAGIDVHTFDLKTPEKRATLRKKIHALAAIDQGA